MRFLVINPRSGGGRPDASELSAEARNRGITVHVLGENDDLATVVRSADADVIGMAGGDGSLGLVAAITVERGLPFVCIPFGTRNHFARDLGLDRRDPIGALASFEQGVERSIDLARVNGRAFVNNASLGIYADLVEEREHHRRRGVALARLRALARTVRNRERMHLAIDGGEVDVRVLVIANNAYTLTGVEMGSRERIDEGLLHGYLAERLMPGGWTELPPRTALRIESLEPRLTVALDGEPVELQTPLDFAIEPGALRVLVPNG